MVGPWRHFASPIVACRWGVGPAIHDPDELADGPRRHRRMVIMGNQGQQSQPSDQGANFHAECQESLSARFAASDLILM